jgi:hypothetical protein
MNKRELASKIANLEGKKHQASVGDVREILAILFALGKKDDETRALIAKSIGIKAASK